MRIAHKKRTIWLSVIVAVLVFPSVGYAVYHYRSNSPSSQPTSGKTTVIDYRSSGLTGTGVVIGQQTDTSYLANASAGFKLFIWQEVTKLRAVASNDQLAPSDVQKYQTATITVDQIADDRFAAGSLSTAGQVLWAKVDDSWKQISVGNADGKFDCTSVHKYNVPDKLTNGGQCVDSNLIQSE